MIEDRSEVTYNRWEPEKVVNAYVCRMANVDNSDFECDGGSITLKSAAQNFALGAGLLSVGVLATLF